MTSQAFRIFGRAILRNGLGGGNGGGGGGGGQKVNVVLPTFPPDEEDYDEDSDASSTEAKPGSDEDVDLRSSSKSSTSASSTSETTTTSTVVNTTSTLYTVRFHPKNIAILLTGTIRILPEYQQDIFTKRSPNIFCIFHDLFFFYKISELWTFFLIIFCTFQFFCTLLQFLFPS